MKRIKSFAILSFLLSIYSCSIDSSDSEEIEEWDGFYTFGFEINAFTPCGLDESWWVFENTESFTEFYSQYAEVARTGCRVYVRIKGIKTQKGNYGHSGHSDRGFEITELLEARCAKDGDCD